MPDVLVCLGMLQMMRHHSVLWRGVRVSWDSALVILVVFIIAVLFAHEVLRTLVLVCAAILRDLSVSCSFSATLNPGIRDAYILIAANGVVDVARGKLVQLLVVAKDDDGDVDGTEHRELMRLFEQTAFALQKSATEGQCWLVRGYYLYTARARRADGLEMTARRLTLSGCGHP
jgi:hypothetical protein